MHIYILCTTARHGRVDYGTETFIFIFIFFHSEFFFSFLSPGYVMCMHDMNLYFFFFTFAFYLPGRAEQKSVCR